MEANKVRPTIRNAKAIYCNNKVESTVRVRCFKMVTFKRVTNFVHIVDFTYVIVDNTNKRVIVITIIRSIITSFFRFLVIFSICI